MNEAIKRYRELYEKLLPEINSNIEKYRKGTFTVRVQKEDGTPVSATIKAQQKKHAFDFGTSALMLGTMDDKEQEYRDAVSNLFNLVTTTFCWGVMETEPGKFRFSEDSEKIFRRPPSDTVLKFAKANNMKAKGQPLFCGRWCPEWVPEDYEKLKELWINYVTEVAKRYGDSFYLFDVVNESYQVNGSWMNMHWLPVSNGDFVRWLLETVSDIFSENCILERNEATHVNFGEPANQYYEENKKLLEDGVRLDSIGIQFHYHSGKHCIEEHIQGPANLESLYNTYQRMSSLGIPLYISEITIPSIFDGMSLNEGEDFQGEILDKLYHLWFSIPNMQGIIYWNLKDGEAWGNEGDCRGALIDEYMRKKKAYYKLEHLIKREWNTCVTTETNKEGILEFSGFYGDYDITLQIEGENQKKYTASFNKDKSSIVIRI